MHSPFQPVYGSLQCTVWLPLPASVPFVIVFIARCYLILSTECISFCMTSASASVWLKTLFVVIKCGERSSWHTDILTKADVSEFIQVCGCNLKNSVRTGL